MVSWVRKKRRISIILLNYVFTLRAWCFVASSALLFISRLIEYIPDRVKLAQILSRISSTWDLPAPVTDRTLWKIIHVSLTLLPRSLLLLRSDIQHKIIPGITTQTAFSFHTSCGLLVIYIRQETFLLRHGRNSFLRGMVSPWAAFSPVKVPVLESVQLVPSWPCFGSCGWMVASSFLAETLYWTFLYCLFCIVPWF